MGREDRHQQHIADRIRDPFGRHAIRCDLSHCRSNRFRAWPMRIAQIAFAQDPQALELFGEIHQAEEMGKGAQQVAGLLDRELLHNLLELALCVRIIRAAQAFGKRTHALFKLECFGARLASDRLTEQIAKKMYGCREPFSVCAGVLYHRHRQHYNSVCQSVDKES